ncbi:uncharacterized protein LODBEIA_P35470 [Lodderomyces beijingensis]|uniref:protein kinase C n=1 Tax=Lodderomyces beijingensis TaxID=1775926 RepID=A0ABP0ZMG3_9ASCO
MSQQNSQEKLEEVIKGIKGKIEIEQNIIQGYQDVKRSSTNAEVQQKCKSKIIESQTLIDYYSESLNKLTIQMQKLSTNDGNGYGDGDGNGSGNGTGAGNGSGSASGSASDRHSTISEYKPSYSRLDLIKYECPSLGHKIQHMIQQLQFKLQVENQYREANKKISHLYLMDGDKSSSNAAEGGKAESDQRIQLLEKTLKKYQNFNINWEDFTRDYEIMDTPKHVRKPLSGKLFVNITCVRDVDHIATSAFKKRETVVSVRIDDVEKSRTKPSKNDNWSEEIVINVEKSHEIELSVMDKQGSSYVPIAINWLSLFDLAEEIRKKKVANDRRSSGWLPASNLPQANGSSGKLGVGGGAAPAGAAAATAQNEVYPTRSPGRAEHDAAEPHQKVQVSTWISLEPCGQMLLSLNFEKSVTQGKQFMGPLGRHGAIRQKKEEVFEQQGHQFVQKQFYNVMCCALCGEFLRYSGFQCQDCKFLCHKKCYQKVVTKCISKSGADYDAAQLKHRIPHRFEPITNHGTKWCCHCGYLLPWGKKNARKCSECGVMCHAQCTHLVPDLCGMSLQMANEILATIKSTKVSPKKIRQVQEKARTSLEEQQQQLQKPPIIEKKSSYESGEMLHRFADEEQENDYEARLPTTNNQKLYQEPVESAGGAGRGGRRRPPQAETPFVTPPAVIEPISSDLYPTQQPLVQPVMDLKYCPIEERKRQEALLKQQQQQEQQQQQQQQAMETDKLRKNNESRAKEDEFRHFDYDNIATQDQIMPLDEKQEPQIISPFEDQQIVPPVEEHKPHHHHHDQHHHHHHHHHQHSREETPAAITTLTKPKSKRRRRKVGLDDFQFLAVLGKGNFGKVMLAESRHTQKLCAIKVLKKDFIVQNDEAESVKSEKRVFLTANREMHPFLLNLHCCFQTENRIYFVMEYISGGDLMWHIQKNRFTAKRAKFYACEVLLGLKYFHDNGIVYRDLKLDNILLTTKGHIKIGDYGLCKENMWQHSTTTTFCGTPEFMAPEIVLGKHYDRSVDWWAFGVLLFQMLLCQSPFKGEDEDDIFNAIEKDEVKYPISLSRQTVLVLQALLTKDPAQRLGSGPRDAEEIMEHSYFQDVNFDDVLNCRVPPPYIPEVHSEHDYSNFDKEFTSETPRLTPVDTVLTSEMQEQFRGFSHISEQATI